MSPVIGHQSSAVVHRSMVRWLSVGRPPYYFWIELCGGSLSLPVGPWTGIEAPLRVFDKSDPAWTPYRLYPHPPCRVDEASKPSRD
jgi:hypothetical protein